MPAKVICPPKDAPAWKKLVEAFGENRAFVAYFRHSGDVPDVESARVHLSTRPADYTHVAAARPPEAAPEVAPAPENAPSSPPEAAPVPQKAAIVSPEAEAVPIHMQRMTPEEAAARIPEIDRQLQDLDDREMKLGRFKPNVRNSLADERRQLLTERLERQIELGSPEAKDALHKHFEMEAMRNELPDRLRVIRKYVRKNPFILPRIARDSGVSMSGELKELYETIENHADRMSIFRKKGATDIDRYGQNLAEELSDKGVIPQDAEHQSYFYGEGDVLDAIKEAFMDPDYRQKGPAGDRSSAPSPMPPKIEIRRPIVPSAPARAVVPVTVPFAYGPVGRASVDLRTLEGGEHNEPADWARDVGKALARVTRGKAGDRKNTRAAVAMRTPDGKVVLGGLVKPQQTQRVGKVARAFNEVAVQRMGGERAGEHVIQVGGTRRALVEDLAAAGYTPIAVIHFDGEPTEIHTVFPNEHAFNDAWAVSEKTPEVAPAEVVSDKRVPEQYGFVEKTALTEQQIQSRIDDIGRRYEKAAPDERARMDDELERLFDKQDRVIRANQTQTGTDPVPYRTMRETEHLMPVSATRAHEFQAVAGRSIRQGMKIDQFARSFYEQGSTDVIQKQIDVLKSKLASAKGPANRIIQEAIDYRQSRIKELKSSGAVTYTPWHIGIAMDNIQNATVQDLVKLLHESVEAAALRLSVPMRGRIIQAVDESVAELRARAASASRETGVPLARETGALDLLAETMAQKMAAMDIPDHPTIIGQIVRWVKELYYRVAMAAQSGFGRDPDHKIALGWFENQMNRLVYGDYDQRLGRMLDSFLPEPMHSIAGRFTGRTSTPAGIVDFFDPQEQHLRQPDADPTTSEALKYNIAFRTTGSSPGKELDIPDPEARAREDTAALNQLIDFMEGVRQEIAPTFDWKPFLKSVNWRGDDPKDLVAEQETRFKGAKDAKVGGDRMTADMDKWALTKARRMVQTLLNGGLRERSKAIRTAETEAGRLTDLAKETNKVEGDLHNAAMHEDLLKLDARDLVHEFVRDMNRGLETAQTHGDLARAVLESENLLETDPIPERFQQVFKQLSDGGISIFGYIREIAKLDLPLTDMTNREVLDAIKANADDTPILQELSKNRPLAVALSVLARRNAGQVDQIQLGWLRNMEQRQAIRADLDEIRDASQQKLRAMQAQVNEQVKAIGLRARMKKSYLEVRQRLKTAQGRVDRAQAKAALLEKAIPHLSKKLEDLEIAGAGNYSEWSPNNGAEWTAMQMGADGKWTKTTRVLRFGPEGNPLDPGGISQALAHNQEWLEQNVAKKEGKLYEAVKRQTNQIGMIDVMRKYHAAQIGLIDRWVQPIGDELKAHGGAGGRGSEMVRKFDNVMLQHAKQMQANSAVWSKAFRNAEEASGIRDHGLFFSQIYHPVMYFLGTNPGLEEGPAIRRATEIARQHLSKPPAADFNEKFAAFLRATKLNSEYTEQTAFKEGAMVRDPKLRNELRRAIGRGWITTMRSMDGAAVSTILRVMEKAGWRVEMKEVTSPDGTKSERMGRAVTFDHLTKDEMSTRNSETLDKALQAFFPSPVVHAWLEPFINKGGEEILRWAGKPIFQQDLQDSWVESGGNILKWIDGVARRVGIEPGEKAEPGEQPKDTLADFRLSVLHQLNGLFGMESRLAADSSQVRQMFDPQGPKPHVIMDARQNDLLPPEHLKFQSFDEVSSRNMLGQIAFHSAFGRNGERMIAALNELISSLGAKHQDYQGLKATTRAGRIAEAAAQGWNYKDLGIAAKRYNSALEMQRKLEGIFGVNNPAGPFNDMRTAMEVVHGMAGQLVDNPTVGFYHLLSGFERPLAMRSFGPATVAATGHFVKDFAKTGFGSLLQALNLHLYHASDEAKEVMATQGSAFRNLPYSTVTADIGQRGRSQTTFMDRYLIRPIRMLRALQQKGVAGGASGGEFPRFAGIPGLGILNWIMQISTVANATSQIRMMENLVSKGIRYFSTHREDYENPGFRFKPEHLVGKWDKGVFDYFRAKTTEYGMGNLEDIVRQAMPAATKGERLINKDQAIRLSQMASSELDGATSLSTTPSVLQSNPILKMGMPLLRWPLWKMHQTHEAFKTVEGRQNFISTLKGLGTLAMWNLPVGIAMTFVMDRYSEDLLHKKSNLPATSPLAGIPVIGIPLDLLTSEKPWLQNMAGYAARMGKAGNIYGLGADLVGQIANPNDSGSGQRQFSLDQRVLVMSQFLNFKQALENVVHQGGDTSWASVWKPFMSSLGGGGALQSIDLVNNALGLDNAESRLVRRINASAWLRSAGEEAGIEIRSSGGMSENPTQLGMWVREMQLAAMANDRLGFLDAHRKALEAARKAVSEDQNVEPQSREREAQSRVLSSWRSRDPMEVFRFKPTPLQFGAVLANMDTQGQDDVRQAIARYREFSALIEPTPFEEMLEKRMTAFSRPPGYQSSRARQANADLFQTTY